MTGTTIVERAREFVLIDIDSSNRRWADAEEISWINQMQRDFQRLRPDTLYTSSVNTTAPSDITALTATLDINDMFESAAVNYLVSKMLLKDTETPNSLTRSEYHYNMFKEELIRG